MNKIKANKETVENSEKKIINMIKCYETEKNILNQLIKAYTNRILSHYNIISYCSKFKEPNINSKSRISVGKKPRKIGSILDYFYVYSSGCTSVNYSLHPSSSKLLNEQVAHLQNSYSYSGVIVSTILKDFCHKYDIGIEEIDMQNAENIICDYIRKDGGVVLSEEYSYYSPFEQYHRGYDEHKAMGMFIPQMYEIKYSEEKFYEIGRLFHRQIFEIGKEFYYKIRSSELIDELHIGEITKKRCGEESFSSLGYKDLDSLSQQIGVLFALLERKKGLTEDDFNAGLPMDEYEIYFKETQEGFSVYVSMNTSFSQAIRDRQINLESLAKKQSLKEW